MIMSLRSNQRLLHTRQNLFCLRQRQPQIGDLGKAGGSIDLYQVDTICRDVGARFDQSQNPTHARSPGQKDKDKDRRIAPGPIPPISGQSLFQRSVNVPNVCGAITGLGVILAIVVGIVDAPKSRSEEAQNRYGANIKIIPQNWSDDERLAYYFTSQGSAALHYGIFLNVERADSTELLRSDASMSSYGFVTQPADPVYNPDGLPIGIAKTSIARGRYKGQWAGLTCAACHNGEIQYRGAKIRITGGNNGALDMLAFLAALDDALQATVQPPEKFDRLAARLGRQNAAERDELRREVLTDA